MIVLALFIEPSHLSSTWIYSDPIISNIPHHEALKRIFPSDEVELKPQKDIDDEPLTSENFNVVLWLFPGHTMPRFVQLLGIDDYRYSVIKGLIVSGGELTESLVSLFISLKENQQR